VDNEEYGVEAGEEYENEEDEDESDLPVPWEWRKIPPIKSWLRATKSTQVRLSIPYCDLL
jgi:beta-xylosidase